MTRSAFDDLRELFPHGGPVYDAALARLRAGGRPRAEPQTPRKRASEGEEPIGLIAPADGATPLEYQPKPTKSRRRAKPTVAEQRAACRFADEDEFQVAVVAEARRSGLRVESTLRTKVPARVTHAGLPDVRWWHPLGGLLGAAELKMPGGKLSVEQTRTLLELQRCTEATSLIAGEASEAGMPHQVDARPLVFVWTPADWDEIVATFAAWTTTRRP